MGQMRYSSGMLTDGRTLVYSSAGIVTRIESVDIAFVASFVIKPVLPMKTPAAASVPAWSTDRVAVRMTTGTADQIDSSDIVANL